MLSAGKLRTSSGPLATTGGQPPPEDEIVRVHCADNVHRDVRASLLMDSSTQLERILSSRSRTSGDVFKIEVPIKSALFDLLVSYFSSDCIALRSCSDAIQLNKIARELDLPDLAQCTKNYLAQNFSVFVGTGIFEEFPTDEMIQLQEMPFLKDLDFDRDLFVEKTRRWTLKKRERKSEFRSEPVALRFGVKSATPELRRPSVCLNPDALRFLWRRGADGFGSPRRRRLERRDSELSVNSTSSWMSFESVTETSIAVLTEDNGKTRLFKILETHAKEYSCRLPLAFKPTHPTDAAIVKDKLYFVDRRKLGLSSISLRKGGSAETVVETAMKITSMAVFNHRLYVSIVDEVFLLEGNKLEKVGSSNEYILEFVVLYHSDTVFQFIHRDVRLRLHYLTCERPDRITKAFKSFQTDWLIGADGSRVFTINSNSPKELMVLQNFQRTFGVPVGDTFGRNSVYCRGRIFSCTTRRDGSSVNVLSVETKEAKQIPVKGCRPVLVLKASKQFES